AVTERDNAVRVYETATGQRIQAWTVKLDNPNENYTSAVAFAPDGKTLAIGATDNQIHLFDLAIDKELRVFRGHGWYVTGLAYSPDGATLYSASYDGTVRRWEVATGKELRVPDGYGGDVAVAYSPDGTRFASTANQGEVCLFDAKTYR